MVPGTTVSGRLSRLTTLALAVWSAVTVGAVVLLGAVHVSDRYGVSAASGVWMGLTAAAHGGTWYPAVFSHGFYGGTRYMHTKATPDWNMTYAAIGAGNQQ